MLVYEMVVLQIRLRLVLVVETIGDLGRIGSTSSRIHPPVVMDVRVWKLINIVNHDDD